MRDTVVRCLVLFGAATALLTELLSPFHLLRRGPLTIAWACVIVAGALLFRRAKARYFASLPDCTGRIAVSARATRLWPFEIAVSATILAIAAAVGLSAWLSPPNSADAMAYHMPRVVYWAQSGSVAFFPTSYFNQISLQPLAEYMILHTYLLTGGDHLVNLVAFLAFLGSIVGASATAGRMGLGTKAQAFAALFCATLPHVILQP